MRTMITLSIFINKGRKEQGIYIYNFHLIGVYNGSHIKKIEVKSKKTLKFSKGSEYILHITFTKVNNGTLLANLINAKECQNIYEK